MTNYRRLRIQQGRLWQSFKDAAILVAMLFGLLSVYGWVQGQDQEERTTYKGVQK